MPLPDDLIHFAASEFKHPERIDAGAAYGLDLIRSRCGNPLVPTSDARTPEENAAVGGSPRSLHLLGRAFDLKWITDPPALWRFVEAVFSTGKSLDVAIELELVNSAKDQHLHVGFYPEPGHARASRLLVQGD